MSRKAKPTEWTPAKLHAEAKRTGQRVEDMPVELVREAQKRGFPDMRSIILPPPIIRESLQLPLLRDLLVTRIGYCSRAAGHYIPRPAGSLDHIYIYCVAGQGWLRIGSHRWEVPAETALFIPRGVPHWYGADPKLPWSTYWVHFTGRQPDDYFAALRVNAAQPLMHLACSEELLSAFRLIEGFMAEVHVPANLVAASGALARFLGLMQLRRFTMQTAQRTDEQNVQQTIGFMRANLARHIPLRELAQLAHMSVSRYETVFAQRTGNTPINYFNRMRIQHASRLLLETNRAAKEIAAELGFDDPHYFSRLFKKHTGLSPVSFRQHPPARDRRG